MFIKLIKFKRKIAREKSAPDSTHARTNAKRGFTLIEMLVAVGLFAIVMLICVAVILAIISGNRKSQSINTVVNNLNFSIESMIRDIKTGYWYQCYDYQGQGYDLSDIDTFKANYMNQKNETNSYSCNSVASQPINYISFVSTLTGTPRIVEYYYEPADSSGPGRIYKSYFDPHANGGSGGIVKSILTTPEIDVEQLDYYINNPPPALTAQDRSTNTQPSVFLLIKGTAKLNNDKDVSQFGVQTFISQRLLNI